MTTANFAEQLARDAVDGLLKQAAKQVPQETKDSEVTIDPETQRKLIEREIKMAADTDFRMTELAKETVADKMERNLRTPEPQPAPAKPPEQDKATMTKEIGKTAKDMLDMGVPPNVVAQYLTGSTTPMVPIALGGGGGGLTLSDVLTLVDRMNASRENSEVAATLREMREEIKAIKSQPRGTPVDPITAISSPLDGLDRLVSSLERLGIVRRVGNEPPTTGKTLEEIKEDNRMTLEREKLAVEKEKTQAIENFVQDTIPQIGEYIASRAIKKPEAKRTASTPPNTDEFTCGKCGATILAPEGAGSVKCGKCGEVYEEHKVEVAQ